MRRHEQFLLRGAEADPDDLRPGRTDALAHRLGLGLGEGAEGRGLDSGDLEARYPGPHRRGEQVGDALAPAEEVVAPARIRAGPAQGLDRFDPRNLLRGGKAPPAADPAHRAAVGTDQQSLVMGGAQSLVLLRAHDAVGIAEDHEGAGLARPGGEPAPDRRDQPVHVDGRDRNATDREGGDEGIVCH